MNRRSFLGRAAMVAAGAVAADQLELLDKLGWKRKFFPGWSPNTYVTEQEANVFAGQRLGSIASEGEFILEGFDSQIMAAFLSSDLVTMDNGHRKYEGHIIQSSVYTEPYDIPVIGARVSPDVFHAPGLRHQFKFRGKEVPRA